MNLEHAMKNPNSSFASPEAVADSPEFSVREKTAILAQWKDQLTSLLIADEEGMFRTDEAARLKGGANADCLRRVTDVMARLARQEPLGAAGS